MENYNNGFSLKPQAVNKQGNRMFVKFFFCQIRTIQMCIENKGESHVKNLYINTLKCKSSQQRSLV